MPAQIEIIDMLTELAQVDTVGLLPRCRFRNEFCGWKARQVLFGRLRAYEYERAYFGQGNGPDCRRQPFVRNM